MIIFLFHLILLEWIIYRCRATKFSFINSASASLFIRIPACYFLGVFLNKGLYGLGLGAPLASMFGVIMGVVFFLSKKWMRAVIVKE